MTMTFDTAKPINDEYDSVPELDDVEFPCEVCGKESGPYGGRGPKPKKCIDHKKPTPGRKTQVRVTGKEANLAAQATGVLEQLNGILAIGCMALGLNDTAHAIGAANEDFVPRANAALLTDPDLCRLILKGGVASGRMGLGLAYFGMAFTVAPVAVVEMRGKKEERLARKAESEDI